MGELANCARCGAVFVRTLRDICQKCYKEEEEAFETVYQFVRNQKNREATLSDIVEATGVDEKLIIKFIKEKRLHTSQFPYLAYPCERCGNDIASGKLCADCSKELLDDLARQEELEKRSDQLKAKEKKQANIYYSINKEKR